MAASSGSGLSIRAVDVTPIELPLATPISSSLGTYRDVPGIAVRVHTDEGVSGFGFNLGLGGHPSRALAAYVEDELSPLIIGCDASDPASVWMSMWSPNKARMRGGLGVWALSAVDIACWDIAGRATGASVHSMLGGGESRVAVYGSGGWLSLSDSELLSECQAFAALGINSYKYKIGSPDDESRTALLREEMGSEFNLLVDANQRYDVAAALEVARMLADYDVGWIEEPVLADTIDDLARVAEASPVPVAAGENAYFRWGFQDICDRDAAAYLQPDVVRCGGITEFAEIAAIAERHGVHLSSHLWHEISITLVGASAAGWAVEYTELLPAGIWNNPFPVVDGHLEIPDQPGHGVTMTDWALDAFSI